MAQAIAVGKVAVNFALDGQSGVMPVIVRSSDEPYTWRVGKGNLSTIANKEKVVPMSFITSDGFGINSAGRKYLLPLIQGECFPKFSNGLPIYEQLDLHLA